MQIQEVPQGDQGVLPLVIPDQELQRLAPFTQSYPPPPAHYKQKHFESPELDIVREFSDGFASFGLIDGRQIITPWTDFCDMEFKPYNPAFKTQLRNLNQSIYKKMQAIFKELSQRKKPQHLKQIITDLQVLITKFFGICKTIKQLQVRRDVCSKCQAQTRRFEQLELKYGKILEESQAHLKEFASTANVIHMINQ